MSALRRRKKKNIARRVWNAIFGFRVGDFVFCESVEVKSGEVHYDFGRVSSHVKGDLWRVWILSTGVFRNCRECNMVKWDGEVSLALRR